MSGDARVGEPNSSTSPSTAPITMPASPGSPSSGRFVVLRHELPPTAVRPSHWDLLFECGPALRAWALDALPRVGVTTTALALPDHRLAYLDYEGPVSEGRGEVRRVEQGTYRLVRETSEEFVATLLGREFQGLAHLTRVADGWRAVFESR